MKKNFKEAGLLVLALALPLPLLIYSKTLGGEEQEFVIHLVICMMGPVVEEYLRHLSIYKGNGGRVFTWGIMIVESVAGVVFIISGYWIGGILQILSRAFHLFLLKVNIRKGWMLAAVVHMLFNTTIVLSNYAEDIFGVYSIIASLLILILVKYRRHFVE